MAIETFEYIDDLNAANPTATDNVSEGDDHLRGLKTTLKNTFPNVTGAIDATEAELNILDGVTATTAELNILDGVTSTAAELNILDGVTATTAELNVIDMSASGSTSGQLLTSAGTGSVPTWSDAPASGFTSSTFLDQGTLFSRDSANTLSIPDLGGVVDGTLVEVTATTKDLNTSGNWDGVGSYETASNRAGKDFYVYLLSAGGVILSNSSTYQVNIKVLTRSIACCLIRANTIPITRGVKVFSSCCYFD